MPQVLEPPSSVRIMRKKRPSSSFRERRMESSRWWCLAFPHKLQPPPVVVRLGWSEPRTVFQVRKTHTKAAPSQDILLISKHLCAHKNTDTLTFLSFWIIKSINICFLRWDTVSSSAVSWEDRLARSSRFHVTTLFWFFTCCPEHCMWDETQAPSSFLLIKVPSHLVSPSFGVWTQIWPHLPLLPLPDTFLVLFTNLSTHWAF